MNTPDIPTFLGGDWASHDWIDLKPGELLQATVGSTVRAGKIALLAQQQAEAAKAQDNQAEYQAYTDTQMYLERMSHHEHFKFS